MDRHMRTRLPQARQRPRRWAAIAVGAIATTTTLARGPSLDGGDTAESTMLWTDSPVLLPNTLNADADDRYAAHRSHSSHGSHRSHRSSAGSTQRRAVPAPPPAPQSTPTPAPSPVQPVPRAVPGTGQVTPRPTLEDLSVMVVRVQAALMRRGYYKGDIDGLLGPLTRAALKGFQRSEGLTQTGRMDLETLSRLGISIP